MKNIIFMLLALICIFCMVSAQPGLKTNISMGAVTRLGNKLLPSIASNVIGTLPDQVEGKYSLKQQRINSLSIEGFKLSTNGKDTLILQISHFNLNYTAEIRRRGRYLRSNRKLKADIYDGAITIPLKMKNNNGKLNLTFGDVEITAGDAKLKFSRGIIARIVTAITRIFKRTTKRILLRFVRKIISRQLEKVASRLVSSIPSHSAFGSWGRLNLALSGPITYQNNSIGVGFDASVQTKNGVSPSGVPRHNIVFSPKNHLFAFAVDTYVFNSAFATFFNEKRFNKVHTQSDSGKIPMKSWKTSGWDNWPQLTSKYANNDMRVHVTLHKSPVISAAGGQLGAEVIGSIFYQVNVGGKWVSVCEIRVAFSGSMTVSVNRNGASYFVIPQIGHLSQKSSLIVLQIAQFDLKILDAVTNFVSNSIIVPMINNELLNGIQIPTVNGMSLTSPNFTVVQNGFTFSTDVDFTI